MFPMLCRICTVLLASLVAVSADGGDDGGDLNVSNGTVELLMSTTTTTTTGTMDDERMMMNAVSSTEMPFQPYEMRPETYMVPIIFLLIFVVGVLGNGLLVLVFVRHTAMRNVPNT